MARRSWPYVQRVRDKWRGWIMVAGKRHYLPLRDTDRVLARILRHRSVQTTMIYVHMVAEDTRKATARLRLLPEGGDGMGAHG
jgi:integrase